jgi:hypothetical protein
VKGTAIFMDPSLKITRYKENFVRPVVACSLGAHVPDAILPHPCPGDTATSAAGSLYRFGRHINTSKRDRSDFRAFVSRWLKQNMVPLAYDADLSFETWIAQTPYTEARKLELAKQFKESGMAYGLPVDSKYLRVKSFVKDEHYAEYKHARAINSRHDVFKCLVGPAFQLISDQLFSLEWFIKKIPICDRPKKIMRLFRRGHLYFTSDYSSFEAHFTKQTMQDCEMMLVDYMLKSHSIHDWFMMLLNDAKLGINRIHFKFWSLLIEAKRMSGEMDTSTSNSFSNLLFMLYLCRLCGIDQVEGYIEGDDGLFVFVGDVSKLNVQVFADFGLTIKIQLFDDLAHASFCGMIFDLDDQTNVTDPIEAIVKFGWTTQRYARSRSNVHKCLLRAKALSLAYQYPACPILSKLAYKFASLTAGFDSLSFVKRQGSQLTNQYKYQLLLEAHQYFDKNSLLKEPGIKTRFLVDKLFGISLADQYAFEKYIDDLDSIQPLDIPELRKYLKPQWIDYCQRYTVRIEKDHPIDGTNLSFAAVRSPARFDAFKAL